MNMWFIVGRIAWVKRDSVVCHLEMWDTIVCGEFYIW
jgi:hypothetical protein